jgi:hypothetical protein
MTGPAGPSQSDTWVGSMVWSTTASNSWVNVSAPAAPRAPRLLALAPDRFRLALQPARLLAGQGLGIPLSLRWREEASEAVKVDVLQPLDRRPGALVQCP